ncbi:MAG: polysaccharide pyruvyl transferase family protein [Clostridiaceae bacterium]|nr:polysaccharide pyruvyl transferase family protein [Clostridiaceae bacterium]
MKVAYCTGFWCTNIGNSFFSIGVEYVLKKVLGEKNVTLVSDLQTYTTSYGKRLYVDKNQLEFISALDVDYIVLAGPVISKYFLGLWKDILLKLKQRGIGFIILSAGSMKLDEIAREEIKEFFKTCPPYVFSSRDQTAFEEFGSYAEHAYNGICFSFFIPDCYTPASMKEMSPYVVYNFDKINEPEIRTAEDEKKKSLRQFDFEGDIFTITYPKFLTALLAKTDRFTDALIYAMSLLPTKKRDDMIGNYRIIRTDHRFHPHFRRKIYQQKNSFVADIPYGYLNLYANAEFTLSDCIHACAVTLAFGHSAMLFAKTNRHGLLDRVGAGDICNRLVQLDMTRLEEEKKNQLDWVRMILS